MSIEIKNRTVVIGENLDVMKGMNEGCVDLIYADPPFKSDRNYKAKGGGFKDVWKSKEEYLEFMRVRLVEMRRVLKNTGLLYLHCDNSMSHYLKVLMDDIFGLENFRNEIVWYYNSGARSGKDFGRRHDIIFRYSKADNYFFDFDNEYAREPYSPDINVPESKKHYYNKKGKVRDDVWRIKIIAQNDKKERVGYPTQKPMELLERIVGTSCPKDGVVMDPFCGSGSALVCAEELDMKWTGIDFNKDVVKIIKNRFDGITEVDFHYF